MDNLCHTLAGAAMGEAGLKHTTRFGNTTLILAANLPDVDALVFLTDIPAVAVRRGWTHGILAQAMLPLLLAAAVFALDRRRGARFVPLLLLSYIGVLSHVFLDFLNNYGVRLLMPFSARWFYGDAVFIIDVWLWIALGIGVWLAFRRRDERPARAALIVAGVYIAGLIGSAQLARAMVADQWQAREGGTPRSLMVGPMAITPFQRAVIVDVGDAYATGVFSWFARQARFDAGRVPKNDRHPAVARAIAADGRFRAVLVWARFPFYQIEATPQGDVVTLQDLRFRGRVGGVRAVVAASRDSSDRAGPSR